mmetsp:Transcript_29334/g.61743  ORF Transcript_29334/g.61743 Transcript_29334/m.61743 type:complete len:240 (+) Transcript_29334:477-1196(+)
MRIWIRLLRQRRVMFHGLQQILLQSIRNEGRMTLQLKHHHLRYPTGNQVICQCQIRHQFKSCVVDNNINLSIPPLLQFFAMIRQNIRIIMQQILIGGMQYFGKDVQRRVFGVSRPDGQIHLIPPKRKCRGECHSLFGMRKGHDFLQHILRGFHGRFQTGAFGDLEWIVEISVGVGLVVITYRFDEPAIGVKFGDQPRSREPGISLLDVGSHDIVPLPHLSGDHLGRTAVGAFVDGTEVC